MAELEFNSSTHSTTNSKESHSSGLKITIRTSSRKWSIQERSMSSRYDNRHRRVRRATTGSMYTREIYENELKCQTHYKYSPDDGTNPLKWSAAALTHEFIKQFPIVFPRRCVVCGDWIYFRVLCCSACNVKCHKRCIEAMLLNCPKLPLCQRKHAFGVALDHFNEEIPFVLKICVREIETRGKLTPLFYKMYDDKTHMKMLILMRGFENSPHHVNVNDAEPRELAALIKEFLRQLPSPLVPFAVYTQLLHIAKYYRLAIQDPINPESIVIKKLRIAIEQIPQRNLTTFSFLMNHLRHIAECQRHNQLPAHVLGGIFAPLVFRHMSPYGRAIVEQMIKNAHHIFHTKSHEINKKNYSK